MEKLKRANFNIKKLFWAKESLYPFSVFLIKKLFFVYFFLLILITGVQFFIEYKNEKKETLETLNSIANNFNLTINSLEYSKNLIIYKSYVSDLLRNNQINSVALYDNKNSLLLEISKNKDHSTPLDLTLEKKLINNNHVFLGTLILKSSNEIVFQNLKHKYREIFVINFFLEFLVVISLWFFSKKNLVDPIRRFAEELKEISIQDTIPTLTFDPSKIEEISQLKENTNLIIQEIFVLKDSFQVLIDDLTETQEKIVKQNLNLEDEVKKQTKEVLEKETKFRSIFEQSNVGIAITDKKGNIVTCNESYSNFLEFSNEKELLGLNFQAFTHPEDVKQQTSIMKKFLSGKVTKDRMEKRYITKTKKIIWADLSATVIKDDNGEITNFIAIVVDITDRKKNELELKRLYNLALDANSLTGLPGNNSIRKRIEEALSKEEDLSAIYVDLDNFKAYNDNYGFAMGDKVLKHVANILQYIGDELHLKNFFLGHIGGDDFVVLVPNSSAKDYTNLVINDVKESIGSFYNQEDFTRGFIKAFNRQGDAEEFPFVSISMGGLDLTSNNYKTYLEVNDALSLAKKQAKKIKGNSYYFENKI